MSSGHRTQIKKERNAIKDTRPKAHARYIRLSDTKARIVLDQIKGKDVTTALGILAYSPRYAAAVISKLLKSAVANAERAKENRNESLDISKVYVQEVFANQGPTMKRIRARARGSASRIEKKTCHISIILNER